MGDILAKLKNKDNPFQGFSQNRVGFEPGPNQTHKLISKFAGHLFDFSKKEKNSNEPQIGPASFFNSSGEKRQAW